MESNKRKSEKTQHFAILKTEDNNETNNVEEPITSKSLNSNLSKQQCQQLNECEFICDGLTNEDDSNINLINNESDSSYSSIEFYLFEDFDNEESCSDNNSQFSINNMSTNSTENRIHFIFIRKS